jgi:hypothetical protein
VYESHSKEVAALIEQAAQKSARNRPPFTSRRVGHEWEGKTLRVPPN